MNVLQEHQRPLLLRVALRAMINHGHELLDVGDRVWVKLVHLDPERGFIDFARTGYVNNGCRNR